VDNKIKHYEIPSRGNYDPKSPLDHDNLLDYDYEKIPYQFKDKLNFLF